MSARSMAAVGAKKDVKVGEQAVSKSRNAAARVARALVRRVLLATIIALRIFATRTKYDFLRSTR